VKADARLRTVIEAIRDALPQSQLNALRGGPTILGPDSEDLAERLDAIVREAKTIDAAGLFRSQSTLAADPALERTLTTALTRLRTALLLKLRPFLGGDDGLLALGAILREPIPDFLTMVGSAEDENAHSYVIRWLLDPKAAPTVAPHLIYGLVTVAKLPDTATWSKRIAAGLQRRDIAVRREVLVGRETTETDAIDRLDILISGSDFALGIENKVWSVEHDNQTRTYWRWLANLPESFLRAGILLSPSGAPASSEGFRPLSYLEFLGLLVEVYRREGVSGQERIVLASYVKSLAAGVLADRINALKV